MTNDEKHDFVVGLREYVERLLCEHDKRDKLQFDAMRESVDASKVDLERRLETLNELRSSVEKDRSQFVPLNVFNERTRNYDTFCGSASDRLTRIETERGTILAMAGAVVSVLLSLLAIGIQFWK